MSEPLRYPSSYDEATWAPERACAGCNRPLPKVFDGEQEPLFVRYVDGRPTAKVRLCGPCKGVVKRIVFVPEVKP